MGGKSKSSGSQTVAPWKPQQPYLQEGMQGAQDLYNQGPIMYPEGDMVAGRRPSYSKGQHGLADFAAGWDAPGGLYGATEGAMRGAMNAPDIANNPYVQAMMQANAGSIMENLNRTTIPGVEDSALMAGQYGGSRQGVAEGVATGDAMSAIGRSNAGIMNTAYGQGLSAQANAMGMLPQMGQMGMLPGMIDRDIGLAGQGMDQARIDADMQRQMYNQQAPWQNLQNYQSAIGGNLGSQTAGTQPSGGGAGGAVSGALGGAQLGSMFGPWGAGIGAVGGGLLGLFGS